MKDSSISGLLGAGIELVKEVRALHSASSNNTMELKILANQVENFIHGLKKDYQKCQDKDNWPPPSIKVAVLGFLKFLNEVRDTVQEIKKEGRISGMIRARTNAIQIKALKQSMNNRVSCFKMCSELAIQHNLHQILKSQKQTISNQTSTSSDSVNDAIDLTDAQFAEMPHIVFNIAAAQRLDTPCNQVTSLEDQEPNETERNRLVAEETEQDRILREGREHEEQSLRLRQEGETAFDNGEEEMKETQGLLGGEPETRVQNVQKPTRLVSETLTDEQRGRDVAEIIRKLEEQRHWAMERLAKLDLEHQGYIEREKLWSLEEHSSSPPLTKHAKEVDSENEAVASIRPKKTSRVKKSKKKFDGSASTTPSEMRFAGTNMASTSHAFPTQVHFSSPPIFPPSPYQQHGPATPSYALPSAYNLSQYPIYPSVMGAGIMDPSLYGPPPSHSQSHFAPPRTTVNNINSGNVASVTISNVNNVNDNYGNARPKRAGKR